MKQENVIVIDEGISGEYAARFQAFLEKKGYKYLELLLIAKKHPGMPDNHIILHLLSSKTIFLTKDRILHNKVLSKNLKSYYLYEDTFIHRKLKGIRDKKKDSFHKNDFIKKESYMPPETEIRPYVLPSSEKALKRLTTKRRRIRSYFSGSDHIDHIAVTVSWKAFNSITIFGIKFRISSKTGIKALDASESYIKDNISPKDCTIVAITYALILSIQLMLHFIKTKVYYDSPKMYDPFFFLKQTDQTPYTKLFSELYKNFSEIEFIPSTKGRFIERLRTKLENLTKCNSNEIITGYISNILSKLNIE